jgi:predicted Zn finger-like uncharacterized protein
MPITFRCKSCHTSYSVKDTLAGRMAECKHCGQRFQIPYRSPVVKLDDEMVQDEPQPGESAAARTHSPRKAPAGAAAMDGAGAGGEQPVMRSFAEYEPLRKPGKRKKKEEETPDETFAPLPAILTDVWLPIALCVIFYGASVYLVGGYVFRSYGVGAGLLMAGLTALIFWAAIVPLTVRVVEGAADSFGFKPSNALFLQVAAALSLPVYGILFGLLKNGFSAAVAGGLITAIFAVLALAVMFQTSIAKGMQTAVLAALGFCVSAVVTTLLVWLVSVNLIPRWGLNLPWQPPVVEAVAQNKTAEPAPVAVAPVPDAPATIATPAATPRGSGGGLPKAPVRSASDALRLFAARAGERIAFATRNAKLPPLKAKPRPQVPIEVLAKQKQWTITVTEVQRADVGGDEEIRELRKQQTEAQKAARDARDRANDMESDKVKGRTRDALGNTRVVVKSQYSKTAIGAARAEAVRAESQVRILQQKIAKLDRDRQDAAARRVVVGTLDDGRVVQIQADGGTLAALADGMQPTSVWQVKGVGRVDAGNKLAVKPIAFSQPGGAPDAGEPEAAEAGAVIKPVPASAPR